MDDTDELDFKPLMDEDDHESLRTAASTTAFNPADAATHSNSTVLTAAGTTSVISTSTAQDPTGSIPQNDNDNDSDDDGGSSAAILQSSSRQSSTGKRSRGSSLHTPHIKSQHVDSRYEPITVFPPRHQQLQQQQTSLQQQFSLNQQLNAPSSSSPRSSALSNYPSHIGTSTAANTGVASSFASSSSLDTLSPKLSQLKKHTPKRRKVSQACVYCRRSHMTCDEGRPCQRCIKRKIAHLCHDEAKLPPPSGPSDATTGDAIGSTDSLAGLTEPIGPPTHLSAATDVVAAAAAAVAAGATLSPAVVAAVANALPTVAALTDSDKLGMGGVGSPSTNVGALPGSSSTLSSSSSSYSFPALTAFPPLFASEHMGNEFTVLTDFLASLDESQRSPATEVEKMNFGARGAGQQQQQQQQPGAGLDAFATPSSTLGHPSLTAATAALITQSANQAQNQTGALNSTNAATAGPSSNPSPSDPTTQLSSTERFVLTAADPADGTYNDRLNQVITAKFEAGLLKPYNYVNSYARLARWMESHMSPASRQRILNVIGVFRPRFRWVAQGLTDIDLVLVEEAFERLLLEYDRVFGAMGIPSCLWRRTGEIWKCNKEFAALVGVSMDRLRDGRMSIYELMTEESAVNYWEKYGNIAFDAGQKAVLTSCVLKGPDDGVSVGVGSGASGSGTGSLGLTATGGKCIAGNFLPAADDAAGVK
ncbi:hypothetical protein HDU76_008361 [Blyttiomyces sp. JEL0837]|nr:hypothetical protein HDU76_008361 [Blyttiomyces sp. JEL0837]